MLRIFDTTDWEVVGELVTGDDEAVYAVSWNLAGDRVYAATGERSILAWDLPPSLTGPAATDLMPTGRTTVPEGPEPNVMVLVPVPSSPMLAATTFGGQAYLLTEDPLRVVEGPLRHENVTLGAAVGGAGARLAVAAFNRVVVWSIGPAAPGRPEREQTVIPDAADVAFTPDGDLLAVGPGGEISSWTLDPPSPVMVTLDQVGPGLPYFSPDGEVLAMAGFGAGVRLFDADTFEPQTDLDLPDAARTSFAGMVFTPDGGQVLVLSCPETDPSARVYCPAEITSHDRDTGETTTGPIGTPDIAPWSATALAASPDGRWVATGHVGGTVSLRDAWTLEQAAGGVHRPADRGMGRLHRPTDAAGRAAHRPHRRLHPGRPDPHRRPERHRPPPRPRHARNDRRGLGSALPRHLSRLLRRRRADGDHRRQLRCRSALAAGRPGTFRRPLEGFGAAISPDGRSVVLGGQVARHLSLDPGEWSEAACETAGRDLAPAEGEHPGWHSQPENRHQRVRCGTA